MSLRPSSLPTLLIICAILLVVGAYCHTPAHSKELKDQPPVETITNDTIIPAYTEAGGLRQLTGAKLYDTFSDTGHAHTPTTYNPTTLTVQAGTLDAGTVTDLAALGGTLVSVSEATGSPALRVQLTYTGVTAVNNVTLYGRYQGGAGHEIAVQAWNVATSAWDTLGRMATATTAQWYSYPLINGADYLSAGTVLIRLEHLQNGVASHDLFIDYAVVRYASDATGGGVTDHGALTGLTGHDDHTQYALADGSRGSLPAASVSGLASVATSGSYADLTGQPTIPSAATDISYTNPTYITVAAALDQLLYVPISITSYTMNGSASNVSQQVGTSYTLTSLAWTTNKTSPTLQQISGSASYTGNSPYTTSTLLQPSSPTTYTYTLHVHDGADQSNASSSRSAAFYWSRYWSASAIARASITSANVNAMSGELATTHSKTITYDCTGGRYPTFAYPVSFGALAAVTVGGLAFSDFTCSTLTHTNSSGGSPGANGYYVCQFNNIQTGSSIAVVWE